jgi:hypothetical protein
VGAVADDQEHLAALTAARKEAVAERRRLSLLQQQALSGGGGGGVLADADPAAIDALGWETFQRMLHSPEEQLQAALLPSRAAPAQGHKNGVICVQLDPPRRQTKKPQLSSERREQAKPCASSALAQDKACADDSWSSLWSCSEHRPVPWCARAQGTFGDAKGLPGGEAVQEQAIAGRARAKWDLSKRHLPAPASGLVALGPAARDTEELNRGSPGGSDAHLTAHDPQLVARARAGLQMERRNSAPPAAFLQGPGRVAQLGDTDRKTRAVAAASATAPGKAAKAALAIEEKRRQRRAAAEAEKAQREAEVAEHGDRANLVPRRMIAAFRQELSVGTRVYPQALSEPNCSILVAVRKRPLMTHREVDEYDVLTSVGPRTIVCHEPKKDVKEVQTCQHHEFHFDHVFDEKASTADVFQQAVAPALAETLHLVQDQRHSAHNARRSNLTVFAYGQTGSGKTFTMEPIYTQTVQEALRACANGGAQLSVAFFEIYCAKVFDLLRERAEVRTLEDGKGEVQVEHLTELPVDTLDAAMHLIECAKRARVTHANAVHADSSRSHAVLQLLIRSALPHEVEHLPGAAKVAGYCTDDKDFNKARLLSKLVLVDLAGPYTPPPTPYLTPTPHAHPTHYTMHPRCQALVQMSLG